MKTHMNFADQGTEPKAPWVSCQNTMTMIQVGAIIECTLMGVALLGAVFSFVGGNSGEFISITITFAILLCTVPLFDAVKHQNPKLTHPYLMGKASLLCLRVIMITVTPENKAPLLLHISDCTTVFCEMGFEIIYLIWGISFWIVVFCGKKYLDEKVPCTEHTAIQKINEEKGMEIPSVVPKQQCPCDPCRVPCQGFRGQGINHGCTHPPPYDDQKQLCNYLLQ